MVFDSLCPKQGISFGVTLSTGYWLHEWFNDLQWILLWVINLFIRIKYNWRKFSAKPMYICKLQAGVCHYAILASWRVITIVSFSCPIPPSLRVSLGGLGNKDPANPKEGCCVFMYSKYTKVYKAIPLFFSFRVECVSWYWVGRSDWKKKGLKNKKIHQKSRNRRSWYPRMTLKVNIYVFGLGKVHNILYKMFLFFSVLLRCSFFRLKELVQVENGLTTSFHRFFFFFFWQCEKFGSVVPKTMLNGEKKEDGLTRICSIAIWFPIKW